MNRNELRAEMARHGDTNEILADVLGITPSAVSYKINGKSSGFTQKEIAILIDRYDLSSEAIWRIFFAPCVSSSDMDVVTDDEKVTVKV